MKKILTILTMLLIAMPTYATDLVTIKKTDDERNINKIGFKLLNANKIPYKITFNLNPKKHTNACAHHSASHVTVFYGVTEIIDKEDEMASVLAHEIAHLIDMRQGIFKGYFSAITMTNAPKKYEYKADKKAVDMLVKAGYNPLASIIILNKIAPQTRYDWCSSHPLTTRRMMEIYEYIYLKYPQYLVNNEYKDNIYYQNFLLTSQENRMKLEQKIKTKSKKKVKYI